MVTGVRLLVSGMELQRRKGAGYVTLGRTRATRGVVRLSAIMECGDSARDAFGGAVVAGEVAPRYSLPVTSAGSAKKRR